MTSVMAGLLQTCEITAWRTSFAAWHPVSVKHTLKHTLLDRVEIYIFRRDLSSHPAGQSQKVCRQRTDVDKTASASFGGLIRRVRDWLEAEVLTSADGRTCTSLIQSSKMGRAFRLMDTKSKSPRDEYDQRFWQSNIANDKPYGHHRSHVCTFFVAQQPSLLKHAIYSLAVGRIPGLH